MKKLQLLQPLLIKVNQQLLYIKLYSSVISLDVSSLIEAVDVLLGVFYVFSLEYPSHLRVVYGFLEDICGIPVSLRNFISIGSFKRSLRN